MYGSRHLYESQFVSEVYRTVFAGITNLNPWRLRVFIHILDFLFMLDCSYMSAVHHFIQGLYSSIAGFFYIVLGACTLICACFYTLSPLTNPTSFYVTFGDIMFRRVMD